MAAYAIFIRDRMRDPEGYAAYGAKARAAAPGHAIKPLAFYGAHETWEGEPADGVVVLEFADMDAARAWYKSAAYQEAKAQCQAAAYDDPQIKLILEKRTSGNDHSFVAYLPEQQDLVKAFVQKCLAQKGLAPRGGVEAIKRDYD